MSRHMYTQYIPVMMTTFPLRGAKSVSLIVISAIFNRRCLCTRCNCMLAKRVYDDIVDKGVA